ncbi:MAG: DegT/DnrJ/EryC1/StrS family aminotransferase [Nanoarchaeota archaeon]|nr:DegT/DnrJ/EryC1/StrS family aminotransferase [Nanoarchaeota archaeon]
MIPFSKPEIKLTTSDMKKIQKSINSGWFCKGQYVKKLENHFKEKFNVKYAVACSNCTSGLIIAFKVLGIKNKFIGVQSFTWPSIKLAIEYSQNFPIWLDIDKETWLIKDKKNNGIDLSDIIVLTDTFGNESNSFTKKPIIVDAAHGYGLPNLGHRGLIEVVSFSLTKVITGGQGGIILFNDDNLYENIQEFVDLSAKMMEISAYLCLKSISEYELKQKSKLNIIKQYRDFIKIPFKEQKINGFTNYSVFSILLESKKVRDKIVQKFIKNNIEPKTYYSPLIMNSNLINTEWVFNRILSLPIYSEIEKEIEKICKLINEA